MTAAKCAALAELARERQMELDGAIAAWRQGPGADVRFWCGPGCGNCCTLTVNATLPEALAIAAALDGPRQERLAATAEGIIAHARQCSDARTFLSGYRHAVGPCPFLDDDANCTIYSLRPLACRALLSTRPPDWCGVNLAGLPGYERDAFLASLDRAVVAWPTHYAAVPQELAADFERGLVFAMIRFAGFGVTGNLPLLVWLAGQPGLEGALSGSPAQFQQFLASHHADRPFLVQIDVP
ncbi:MAG: YkgJ family cysteine cluster protein [Desulfuromonadales bacterium]|nr:YkgJ family cysteine cluster protein [Desulfuromonadales bacterium]